ncbi:hypothetical protein LXL04_037516 [Taraxacum kok-saghyz]
MDARSARRLKRRVVAPPVQEVDPPMIFTSRRPDWVPSHPWSKFPADLPSMTISDINEHMCSLENRSFSVIYSIDRHCLGTEFLMNHIKAHTNRAFQNGNYFVEDHSFYQLLRLREQIHPILCYEFFATVTFDSNSQEIVSSFQVLKPFMIPYLQYGVTEVSAEFNEQLFWPTVGHGAYSAHITVSMMRDPLHRFLQRLVDHQLHTAPQRRDSNQSSRSISPVFASRSAIARRDSPILGGHLVTALAKFYRIDLSSMKYPLPPHILTYSRLRSNHFIDRNQSGFALPAADGVAAVVPEQPKRNVEVLSEDEDPNEHEDPDKDEDPSEDEEEDPSEHEDLGRNEGDAGRVASDDGDDDVGVRDVHMHRSPPPLDQGPAAAPIDERVQGLEDGLSDLHRHQEIDARWQAGVLLSICRHFNVPLSVGYEYLYAYDPAPAFARPPGTGPVPPTDPLSLAFPFLFFCI